MDRSAYTIKTSSYQQPPRITDLALLLMYESGTGPPDKVLEELFPYQEFTCLFCISRDELELNDELLVDEYPWIRWIIFNRKPSAGTMIHTAASLVKTDFILAVSSSATLDSEIDPRLIQWMHATHAVSTPGITIWENHVLPTVRVPVLNGHSLTVENFVPFHDKTPTLFHFRMDGLYDRRLFVRMGGFCNRFVRPYWQMADFGLRSWLAGRPVLSCNGLRFLYRKSPLPEDATPSDDYPLLMRRNSSFRYEEGKLRLLKKSLDRQKVKKKEREEVAELHYAARNDLETLIREWMVLDSPLLSGRRQP